MNAPRTYPDSASRPTLIVVGGSPGTGKTTLAHEIARAVGCPAVCRDEIKEGMVHATPGFTPDLGDALNLRTLPAFFGVLGLLLGAGVTTVAEAAYQDRLWRPGLEALRGRAEIRIVHCSVGADVALARRLRRAAEDPVRAAHEPAAALDPVAHRRSHEGFDRVAVDAPWIEVDTTSGYAPALREIVAFATGHGGG